MINDEQLNDRLIPDLFSRPGPATTVQQRPTPAASRATPDDPASDVLPETGGTGEQGCRREGAGKALVDPTRPLIQLWIVFSSQHRVHHAAWSASQVKSANSTQIKGPLRQRGMLFTGQPQSTDGKPARKHARRRSTKATESPVKSTRAQLHSTSDRDSQ